MRSLLLLIGAAFCAHAGVVYNASGVFGPTAPSSFFTAPNVSWSLTFTTEEAPVVSNVGAQRFDPVFTNFAYLVNGVDLGLTPTISFFDNTYGGMFSVFFGGGSDQFGFTGPQMFSGTTAAPTMLTGSFTAVGGDYDGVFVANTFVQTLGGTVVTATPEPATVGLIAGGLLAFAAVRRRRVLSERN